MRCRYRFLVKGRLRLSQNAPIPSSGWIFEFELDKGFVKYILVTVPLKGPEQWPMIQKDPEPGVKLDIRPQLDLLPFIKRELRSIQGLLSLFGLLSIDFDECEVEWLPDTDDEKANLHLFTMGKRREPLPDDQIPALPFDVIARGVIAADAAVDIEVPMNFYRRGILALHDENYIEAIYYFYFILESVFGEGKFKKAAVMDAFKKSPELRKCVERAIYDPGPVITINKKLKAQFDKNYSMMSAEKVIRKIVELRGELHHHTLKRKNWHPENQHQFELDAVVLQAIAYNVAFMMAEKYLWDKAVIQAYEALRKEVSKR